MRPQYKSIDIPVFSSEPEWDQSVSLSTVYETIVREALDTSEERIGRRPRCLYGLSFTTVGMDGQETGYARSVIEQAQAMPMIMPVWTEATKLTAPVEIGDTALHVDTVANTLWAVLTDFALLWSSFNAWEVLAVASHSAHLITLSDPVTRDWPERTWVLPILIGKLPRADEKQTTDEMGSFQVEFEERFNGLTDQTIIEA